MKINLVSQKKFKKWEKMGCKSGCQGDKTKTVEK